MKDYIYVDFDFIQSYLAQTGKGLSQSTFYSNSTTNVEGERSGNTEQTGSSGGEVKSKSSHELNLKVVKSAFGGDTSFQIDINNLVYLFETWASKSDVTKESMSIELHDYAIELFENSFISEDKGSQRFSRKENLEFIQLSSNYKDDVKPLTELLQSDFMLENEIPRFSLLTKQEQTKKLKEKRIEKKDMMKVDDTALMLSALNSLVPSPVSVSFKDNGKFYIGALKESNLRMDISEILFSYGNQTSLNVIGVVSRELFPELGTDSQLDMYSRLRIEMMSLIRGLYEDTGQSVHIFKPILVYRSI